MKISGTIPNSTENLSYSPVIFTKSSKMMFLCCSKNWKHFWTQIRFNKWFSLNASCSFLTTSWNFLLLHVQWINNSQSCLLPPFYLFFLSNRYFFNFFRQFRGGKFCCYHIMERILRSEKMFLRPLLNSFQVKVWGWNRTYGKIPV